MKFSTVFYLIATEMMIGWLTYLLFQIPEVGEIASVLWFVASNCVMAGAILESRGK